MGVKIIVIFIFVYQMSSFICTNRLLVFSHSTRLKLGIRIGSLWIFISADLLGRTLFLTGFHPNSIFQNLFLESIIHPFFELQISFSQLITCSDPQLSELYL